MPNPSNVKVQLKTVSSIEGYSVPAYPITKWECISVDLPQSRVVTGTTHYVGGIVSSGNSLWFDRSAQQIPTSADVINIGNLRYCPLSNVVDGNTQYANLYVTGATATIVDSNGNAGDGNIPTPEYSVVQAITAPYGARNIPSEQAVGNALDFKQHILAAGSCIGITAGGVADTIYVSATRTVAPYGQAVHTQVPTEAAVRDALSATSYNLSNYAYALTDALHTTIINSGYATANWVDSNFIHSGEIVPVDVPYASYGRAGKVQFINGSGLTVADDSGTVKLTIAGNAVFGGVMVPSSGGISANTTTGAIGLVNAGYVATSDGTTNQANTYVPLGGMRVWMSGGIGLTSGNIYLKNATSVTTPASSNTAVGGVRVVTNSGLTLANGTLNVQGAEVVKDYAENVTSHRGVVALASALGEAKTNAPEATTPMAPTLHLVTTQFKARTAACYMSSSKTTTTAKGTVENLTVIDQAGVVIYKGSKDTSAISAGESKSLYAVVSKNAQKSFNRYATGDDNGRYCWSSGTGAYLKKLYTVTATPATSDTIFTGTSNDEIYGIVAASATNAITADSWDVSIVSASVANDAAANKYCVPLANIIVDAGLNVNVQQLQVGPIVSGGNTGGGGIASFTITEGAGVSVSNATSSSCTVAVKYASPLSAYNNSITLKYDTSKLTVTDGALTLVDGTGGGKAISSGGGVTVNDSTTYYELVLNKAGTSADAYGGVWVATGSGLVVDTGNTSKGKLYLSSATSQALGGVKLKAAISEDSPGTGSIIPTESAIVKYVTDHAGGGGIASFTITEGAGISVGNATSSSCTVAVKYANPLSANNNSLTLNYDTTKLTVTAGGALTLVNGAGEGGYDGPFKATSAGGSLTIQPGYVVAAGVTHKMSASSVAYTTGAKVLYLTGSAYVAGKVIAEITSAPIYSLTASVGGVFSRTTTTGATVEMWGNGTSTYYTPKGILPRSNAVMYSDTALATSATKVKVPGPYTMEITQYNENTGATVGSATYSAYTPTNNATLQSPDVAYWQLVGTHTGMNSLYVTPGNFIGGSGCWVKRSTEFDGKYDVIASGSILSAGEIPIAEANGANVDQQQYGNITLPAKESEKETDWRINNMVIEQKIDADTKATRNYYLGSISTNNKCDRLVVDTNKTFKLDTIEATTPGTAGTILTMECAGMVYGVPCTPAMGYGMKSGTNGMWINRLAVKYPKTSTNVLYRLSTETSGSHNLGICEDALYLKRLDTPQEIYLNLIYEASGDPTKSGWRAQIDTVCYEAEYTTEPWYSIRLAQITNGVLTQQHFGPIDIRGRWS